MRRRERTARRTTLDDRPRRSCHGGEGRNGGEDRRGETTRRPADRVQQLTRWRVLEDEACGAAAERGVADAGVEGEEDDARVGELGAEAARDLEAGQLGHRVVEEDQVRAQLDGLRHRLDAIRGLADDLEVRLELEHGADALAYGEVIVRDQDPRSHFGPCSHSRSPGWDRPELGSLARLLGTRRFANAPKYGYPSFGEHWYETR